MDNFELGFVKYIHNLGKGKINFLTSLVSSVKMLAILWTTALLLMYFYLPDSRVILWQRIAVVAILHFLISEGIFKYLLPYFFGARKRPFAKYPNDIKPIGHRFSDGSMPSSHMASTVAMVVVLFSVFPAILLSGIFFSLFMGFARIHNGMHYPSDIIVGTVLGISYGLISVFLI